MSNIKHIAFYIVVISFFLQHADAMAQRASYSPPPDFVVMVSPVISGGTSIFHGVSPERYSSHSAFSWNGGAVTAFIDRQLYQRFYFVLTLGVQYDSRSVTFSSPEISHYTITVNSIAVSAGLAFPYIQFHFGVNVPIAGSTTEAISQDIDRVTKIHSSDLNLVFEPRLILYYPFPVNNGSAIIPYLSFGLPLSKVFRGEDSFTHDMKIATLQLGITYPFTVYEYFSYISL